MSTSTARVLFLLLSITAMEVLAKNPFLPPTAFIPDSEPDVFEYLGEKRLFIYGSRDERITGYCGFGHDVWSAPVNDLTHWTNHGEAFHVKQVWDIGFGKVDEQHFGAPDAVYNPLTKKYYLYTFLGALYKMDGQQGPLPGSNNYVPGYADYGPKCVMAQSDSPVGPFVDPVMCDWPPANKEGAFDPSVLVDTQADGSVKVYAFWGMKKGDRWAQLDPMDMHTIIDPVTGKPDRNAWHKTLDPEIVKNSTLFEASSIKKLAEGKYVFIYSPNENNSALAYTYSNRPSGPWQYGGEIIRNDIGWKTGNNHGSIVKVLNQWYVLYHRPTNDSKNRQAMIEPIDISFDNNKISIPTVKMTSQGVHKNGLNPFKRYNAYIANFQSDTAYVNSIPRNKDGLHPISGLYGPTTSIGFQYFNFTQGIKTNEQLQLALNLEVLQKTKITVSVSPKEEAHSFEKKIKIAERTFDPKVENMHGDLVVPIDSLKQNNALKSIGGLKGTMSVFLTFEGDPGELSRLKELEFRKKGAVPVNQLHDIVVVKHENHVKTTPSKARKNESVKIVISSIEGKTPTSILIRDYNDKAYIAHQNPKAPYAPLSYHFKMPDTPVWIVPVFE